MAVQLNIIRYSNIVKLLPIPVGLKLEYLRVCIVPGVTHVEEELLRAREHALDVVHVEPIELK